MPSKNGKQWIFFAAFRYLFSRSSRKYMSARFTLIGLAVGFTAICIVIGVMNGLQEGFLRDIIEIESFHIIAVPDEKQDLSEVDHDISELDEVSSVVRFYDVRALIKRYDGSQHPLIIRGVEPELFSGDREFQNYARLMPEFEQYAGSREIILSRSLRPLLDLSDGKAKVVMMGTGRTVRNVPFSLEVDPGEHTYLSNTADINTNLAFMPLETIMKANAERQPHFGIKLRDENNLAEVTRQLEKNGAFVSVTTWKERNQSFYSALMLEKYGMIVLLSLIFLVVVINAKVSFEKYVFYKRDDIGILRSLGASRQDIGSIFVLQGGIITLTGILVGIAFGLVLAYNINGIIRAVESVMNMLLAGNVSILPYDLPVSIHPGEIIIIAAVITVIALYNIFSAVRVLTAKNPLEILRYE